MKNGREGMQLCH